MTKGAKLLEKEVINKNTGGIKRILLDIICMISTEKCIYKKISREWPLAIRGLFF